MSTSAKINFIRHPQADERTRSASELIKMLLSNSAIVLPEHLSECLNIALWKITQAECIGSKYRTRFRSRDSLSEKTKYLRHDHVFQRAFMVKALLKATPDEVEDIVGVAIGCTVTKDEHLTLNQFKSWDGWERYLRAGITVMDMETGEPANLSQLSADRLLQSN